MKIGLLYGAVKNAGDFLILERSRNLLEYGLSGCEITLFHRTGTPLDAQLDALNGCDILVLAGGPGYAWNIYPDRMPLVNNLSLLKSKFFSLGMGWYGEYPHPSYLYNYTFQPDTAQLLQRIQKDSHLLGCRDYLSSQVLRQNGIDQTIMTGCPAWYDLQHVKRALPRLNSQAFSPKQICISDPANALFFGDQSLSIVQMLENRFPEASIQFLFHSGFQKTNTAAHSIAGNSLALKQKLEKLGVNCIDISGSTEGLSLYDNCDLHVGYRVHAHIYNLSRRNLSILIEEDSRGAGVNQALGLSSITAYRPELTGRHISDKFSRRYLPNNIASPWCIHQLEDALTQISQEGYSTFCFAYSKMQHYFEQMMWHISTIKELI